MTHLFLASQDVKTGSPKHLLQLFLLVTETLKPWANAATTVPTSEPDGNPDREFASATLCVRTRPGTDEPATLWKRRATPSLNDCSFSPGPPGPHKPPPRDQRSSLAFMDLGWSGSFTSGENAMIQDTCLEDALKSQLDADWYSLIVDASWFLWRSPDTQKNASWESEVFARYLLLISIVVHFLHRTCELLNHHSGHRGIR